MGEERITPSGWLPPAAPGGGAPPRFEPPAPAPQPREAPWGPAPPRAQPGAGNPPALWALVLALSGLALLMVSLGTLFILTLPCSVAGWVLAVRARGRVDRGLTTDGEGQATAALWMARIGVIAGIAAAVVLIALVASGFDAEQLRDDLERELDDRREGGGGGVRTGVEGLRAVVGR